MFDVSTKPIFPEISGENESQISKLVSRDRWAFGGSDKALDSRAKSLGVISMDLRGHLGGSVSSWVDLRGTIRGKPLISVTYEPRDGDADSRGRMRW